MREIDITTIKTAVKHLCQKTATTLDKHTYQLISNAYKNESHPFSKEILGHILQNSSIANKTSRPICQDTGQTIVFLEIGQDVHITGGNLYKEINSAISESYQENYLRKSINTALDRVNTQNNTPAIIHTEIIDGDQIKISVCLKGGGSENMSRSEMLPPSKGKDGIIDLILETVKKASLKSCPPLVIGVGIGGNLEKSAINSKKALLLNTDLTNFEQDILDKINALNIGASGLGGDFTALSLKIIEEPCHIASLPVSITLNCHAARHASATIKDQVVYDFEEYEFEKIETEENLKEVHTNDTDSIKKLKTGEKIHLTGKIYTARDEAHKRLVNDENPPFDIDGSIIFYAGPCPPAPGEIIGPIGPTTSSRMDAYTPILLDKGLLGAIGKGERSKEVLESFIEHNAVYLIATGGIASLLAKCVKSCKLIAYEDLGPEAIYELYVEKMPLFVDCGRINE